MANDHPLLAPFFETGTGFVLYKGYPPQRGDDVTALLALASALPEGVQFAPVPPRWNTVTDLRYLLPDVLWHLRDEIAPNEQGARGAAAAAANQPADLSLASDLHAAQDVLEPMLRQALRQMKSAANSKHALGVLRDKHPDLLEMMLRTIATNPDNLQRARAMSAGGAVDRLKQRDMLREEIQIPQDVPILIIGRPELFLGYYPWTSEHEKTDLRRMLDSAGYPGRFHFADDRYAEWLSAQPEAAPTIRDQRPPPIRDRKTFRVYSLNPEGRRREDVGFVLASRTPHGQIVMVATGSTSLGTFAAVQLLLQNRRGFAEAVEQLRTAEQTVTIDLGFRCRVETASARGHVPRPRRTDPLAIELLNPGDVIGYSWGRRAYEVVHPILASSRKEGQLGEKPFVHWEWKDSENALTHVEVTANPYKVSPQRTLYPSADFGRLLNRISTDLEVDRKNWASELSDYPPPAVSEKAPPAYVEAINDDSSFRTFRPILLLGATGTGKAWIAEMIASTWGGKIIDRELEEFRAEHPSTRRTKGFDFHPIAECRWLPPRLADWMGTVAKADPPAFARNIHTLSVVETPEALLGSQLFGIVEGAATDVEAQLSAFVVAGTGALFLDELLELEPALQTRLLVALQTGKIMPIGSATRRPYFCRIVAATNRAEEEADLRQLTTRHEVRTDLVARFTKKYEIPRLEKRPLEIVPILMSTILSERAPKETTSIYLRISRPALELLLTYSYPENIRQLQAFALGIPDDLVQSFALSEKGDHPSRLSRKSIMLEHMASFGVGKGDMHGGLATSSYIDVSLEPEMEFYEFAFPGLVRERPNNFAEERQDPDNEETVPTDSDLPLTPAGEALALWIVEQARDFAEMKRAIEGVRDISDLDRQLENSVVLSSGLKRFTKRLWEAHEAMRNEDKSLKQKNRRFGLTESWMLAILKKVPVETLPLNPLPESLSAEVYEWTQTPRVVAIVDAARPLDQPAAPGPRPKLHKGVLAGFLTGRWVRHR